MSLGDALLGHLDQIEALVQNLKLSVAAAGEDDVLAANSYLDLKENTSNAVAQLLKDMNDEIEGTAEEMFDSLVVILEDIENNPNDDVDVDALWSTLHQKLREIEGGNQVFRKECLFRTRTGGPEDERDSSILHWTCKLNPPVAVVTTLLDITPANMDQDEDVSIASPKQYNHLARNRGGKYPLNIALKYGCSPELVKLLTSRDVEKKTVKKENFVLRVLIENRENHHPDSFAEILRHLVVLTACCGRKPWEQMHTTMGDFPIQLLFRELQSSGLSIADIIANDDFIFITKATFILKKKVEEETGEHDEMLMKIDQITFPRAFLACSSCFEEGVIKEALRLVVAADPDFLLQKDSDGEYPLHHILRYESSFFVHHDSPFFIREDGTIHFLRMTETILDIEPRCAQIVNDKSKLPLHLAVDVVRRVRDSLLGEIRLFRWDPQQFGYQITNFALAIWKAYPEAADVLDQDTGLPPFALSLRGEQETVENSAEDIDCQSSDSSISSIFTVPYREEPEMVVQRRADLDRAKLWISFCLLRKHPEVLPSSGMKVTGPPIKRLKIE